MASRYNQILTAVITEIAARYERTIETLAHGWRLTKTGEADLYCYSERRYAATHGAPPRFVFVQTGGEILPPDMVGGGLISATERANIRAIRRVTIETEIWGGTEERTETMLHDLIDIWDRVTHNAVAISRENWEDQQEDSFDRYGRIVTLELSIQIPVYRMPADTLTTVTEITQSYQLDLDLT